MGFPIANRQYEFVSPPRAYGPTGPVGQEIVLYVSAAGAQTLNLVATTFGEAYSGSDSHLQQGMGAPPGQPKGLVGSYVTIYADGQDIGIIFGSTGASVTGSNAPSLTAVGSLNTNPAATGTIYQGQTGTYVGVAGTCHRIPAGTERRYLTQTSQDHWLGFIGASGPTGTVRIFQSSPANP